MRVLTFSEEKSETLTSFLIELTPFKNQTYSASSNHSVKEEMSTGVEREKLHEREGGEKLMDISGMILRK